MQNESLCWVAYSHRHFARYIGVRKSDGTLMAQAQPDPEVSGELKGS